MAREQLFVQSQGITFDDVLVSPAYSEVHPSEVLLKTRLTDEIVLNIPVISSAMDTVTEHQMAITMASIGGLGVIHRNLSIEAQVAEVRKVKKFESYIITDPLTVESSARMGVALELMQMHGISGLPVVDNGYLRGIVTRRDARGCTSPDMKVSELMTPRNRLVVAPADVSMEKAKDLMFKGRVEKLPLVDASDRLVGLITLKDILKSGDNSQAVRDAKGRIVCGAAVGADPASLERIDALVEAQTDIIVIDTAHGHSKNVLAAIAYSKKRHPKVPLVAGNIATREAAAALINAGADVLKIGIGPGSICTTRIVSGVGVPQISALLDCSEEARGRVTIIADGGIRYSGDVNKAIIAGASAVMIGSLFAGTEESPSDVQMYKGIKYKAYRGMGSLEAMKTGLSADRYGQDGAKKLVPEGVSGMVPYKGSVKDVVFQLTGGMRSGCGYVGAKNLDELREKGRFIKISGSALMESHVHNVIITNEAPNYTGLGDGGKKGGLQ